ncbi:STAS domain-containing protein [Saccharopolyspora gloriosae]|uniref:STAS domain-containing protein n=1 Tax=Saccharopolyspora gloriosae TaxID=455344 RepID=UPI001FB81E6A|nr:STAS domain-containing protein [Saccharopolyspora gloriosae]
MSYPTSTSVAVHLAGDLDTETTPRLRELLAPRLASMAESVILDLSGLRFLGVAGLQLLAHVHRRAASRGMMIYIVDGPTCVDRALRAAGSGETVPTYSSVTAAVAELAGRREIGATA